MPFNGAGVWSSVYTWVQDRDSGIPISAPRMDAQFADIAANGFGNTITRDAQGKPAVDMDWNGKRLTNMAAGTAINDAVTLKQLQSGAGGTPYNLLANGDFRIWQRPGWTLGGLTTTASVAAGQYIADRWYTRRTTNVAYSLIQTNGVNSTVPCRTGTIVRRTAGDANTEVITIAQSILQQDLLSALAWGKYNNGGVGNYINFSVFVSKGANFTGANLTIEMMYSTSADQNPIAGTGWTSLGTTVIPVASLSATPTATRVGVNVNWTSIPTTARSLCVRAYYTPTGTAGADDSFYLTAALLVNTTVLWDGTTANIAQAPVYYAEDYTTNLYRCMLFTQKSFPIDTAIGDFLNPEQIYSGYNYVLNTCKVNFQFKTPMRSSPTVTAIYRTTLGATNGQPTYMNGGAWTSGSAVIIYISSPGGMAFDFTTVQAAGTPTIVTCNWLADCEYY